MPIDVNSYNAQFDQFVRFAEQAMQAGKAKTIASLGAEGATGLAARDIKPGSGDSVDVAEIAWQSLVDQAYDRELRRAGVVE